MRQAKKALVAAAALAASAAVQAQFYMGGNVGLGHVDIECGDVGDCDKNAVGFKLYGGYRFDNGWAVEAGYIDWGKAAASESLASVGLPSSVLNLDLRSSGFGVGLAYFLPLSEGWTGVFRFGGVQNRGNLDATDGTLSVSESKGAFFAYGGLGVAYRLTPQLALAAEADFSRTRWCFDGECGSASVQLYSVGLRYAF
jgi:OmpA-OmpF porin, OOP family